MRISMKCATCLLVALALCATATAANLATCSSYDVGGSLEYPWDFETHGGTLTDCIESASIDIAGAGVPGSPAYNQWSAVGFDDGGSFIYTVDAKDGCCFDPDLFYCGGMKRSGSGPNSCEVVVSWIDCGETEVESATIETIAVTESYQNRVYDLDALIPDLGCEALGCVEWLQVEFLATGATSQYGTFRVGDYYDGGYTDFGITGECCNCVPEPTTVSIFLIGGLCLAMIGRRRK